MSGGRDGDVLVTRDLTVRRIVLNALATNGFVVKENDTGAIAIVDPGDRAADLVEAALDWGGDVRAVLVTHLHGDHCGEAGVITEAFPAADLVGPPGGPFVPDRPVSGGEAIEFGAETIQVCATPGHSPESVSYQICDSVFVGDFVFLHATGRTDGAGASTQELFRVVDEVFDEMPDDTILWCGHGPPTTIGEERRENPFWRVALRGRPESPEGEVRYRGQTVPVLAWAEDYDGGKKALVELPGGRLVIVPGSQVEGTA